MDWTGFFSTLLARVPIERLLFPAPDRSKDIQQFLTATGSPVEAKEGASEHKPTSSVQVAAKQEERAPLAPSLPTSEETTAELKRRLARELYRAELDLASKLRIAGKPCDCLDHKHTLGLEATAEELVSQDPGNTVYLEILDWVKTNRPKVTIEAILTGRYDEEYPHMASQFKDFRKRVVGTAAFSALGEVALPITLEQAKKLAADEAAKEVERVWSSQKAK